MPFGRCSTSTVGPARWPFGSYLLVLVVGDAAGIGQTIQADRAIHNQDADTSPGNPVCTWPQTRTDLTTRDAWLVRLLTCPLAPLAATDLTAAGLPAALALPVPIVGWLSLDLLTVLTVPARRALGGIVQMFHSSTPNTPDTR